SVTRAAILAALESGSIFTSLIIGAGSSPTGNGVVSADVDRGPLREPQVIWRGLSNLAQLFEGIANAEAAAGGPYGRERGRAGNFVPARSPRWMRTAIAVVVVVSLGIATIAIPTPTTLDVPPGRIGALAGGVAWLIASGLIVLLFRGHSTSMRIVLAFAL